MGGMIDLEAIEKRNRNLRSAVFGVIDDLNLTIEEGGFDAEDYESIEALLDSAKGLAQLMALALFDDLALIAEIRALRADRDRLALILKQHEGSR